MLILLHAIWFQYMLPNLVYPERGSIKQREQKRKTTSMYFPLCSKCMCVMRIQWNEKIVVVHQFVMGWFFKQERKSKVTVKTTTLIYGGGEVLKLIET